MSDAHRAPPAGRAELLLLAGLAFILPLYEAPKHILTVLYFVMWVVHRVRAKHWGGPWGAWDSLLAASILVSVIGTALAGIKGGEWLGLRDVVRTLLLLWCVMRAGYTPQQWRTILHALMAGTCLAAVMAAWQFAGSNKEGLELHSVGHANHTATYLCIVFGVALAVLWGGWNDSTRARKLALLAVIAICAAATIATGSRVAVLCLGGVALLVGVMHLRHSRRPLLVTTGVVTLSLVLLVMADPWVLRKHVRNMGDDNVLAYRDQLWERAMTTWRAHPVFGIGMDNFGLITTERYQAWSTEQGRKFDPARDFTSSHAHSLYFDALAERGIIGAAALCLFLAAWGRSLWRRRPRDPASHAGIVWAAAGSALFVTLFIGLVNTTLHNEQAMAAMLCLGAWLAWTRTPS